MREAELPDGTILEFPDETPDEVMDRVVKENIFQQQNAAPPDTMGFGAPAAREAMEPETPELRRDIDVAKAQAGFEALPTWQKPFRAAADVASVYGAGATLGFSDHLAALASGKTVDEERAITQQARDRMGWAAPVAEIGGAISSIPAKGIGLVRNIPALTSASGTGPGWPTRQPARVPLPLRGRLWALQGPLATVMTWARARPLAPLWGL